MKSNRLNLAFIRLLCMGALVLVNVHFVKAQTQGLAQITGKVQDASGAAVPDATVTVASAETGTTRIVASDDQGDYRVLSLPVGRYQIKAEKTGFKIYIQSGVELTVGQQAAVNLVLEVGQVQQQVTVTAEVPVVNTSTVSTAGLVGEQQIKDLPLNGRSFDNLITLNAGAANVTTQKTAGATAQNGNLFSVGGRAWSENLFLMNGVEYPGPTQGHSVPGGVSGQLLGIDAVREFNVQESAYDAQYGQRAGGQINVVSMSGTNALHGSVFEFIRNSVLDARNFFDHLPGGQRIAPFKRNQFGGALGGPIKKDKTFLFGNYEGFRQRLGISDALFVPSLNARNGLMDPAPVNGVCATGTTPYPGLVRAMLPYLDVNYPLPNGNCLGNGVAQAFYTPPSQIREDFGIVRFDQVFSSKDTLSASHLFDDGYSLIPQIDPTFGQASRIRTQVFSMQETHIFSPSLINIATFGYSLSYWNLTTPPLVPYPANLLFVVGRFTGRIAIGGTGGAGSGTISAGGGGQVTAVKNHTSRTTYADAIQWSKGRHQFGAGIWFQPFYSNENWPRNDGGFPTWTGVAQFMSGTVATFTVAPQITPMHWKQFQGAWYAQDIIQVRKNLTLRLGLRHEFTGFWTEKYGRASQWLFGSNGILQTTPTVGSNPFTVNNGTRLFGPRVGIAWDPFGKGKTSIRAGFGTHYNLYDNLGYGLDNSPPYNGVSSFSNANFLQLVPFNPSTPVPPACGPGVTGACTTYAVFGDPTDLKVPTVEEWNLSIEQGITANTSITIGYVGSHGFHDILTWSPNSIPPQTCANAAGCLAGGVNTASKQSVVPQGTFYVPVGTLPNPFLANGGTYLLPADNTSYHGLEIAFKHRYSHGLQFQVNYTWSKAEDFGTEASTPVGNTSSGAQPLNPRYDWGPSGGNKTHKLSANAAYQLPFGQGRRWLSRGGALDKAVGGWQLNSIFTATSGFPYNPTIGSEFAGNLGTGSADRPYWNPNFKGSVVTGNPDHWTNANAFTLCPGSTTFDSNGSPVCTASNTNPLLPACSVADQRNCGNILYGTFGNVGRDVLYGPNLIELDMSLFKSTKINERVSAEFRVEGFNVLNRVNFGTPNVTLFSGVTPSPSAGAITATATTSRQLQFGLKILF